MSLAHPKKNGRPRLWTPRKVTEAIQSFVAHTQRVPTWRDFADCVDGLPHHATVLEHFSSKDAAIQAAGFAPRTKQRANAASHPWKMTPVQTTSHMPYVKCRYCGEQFSGITHTRESAFVTLRSHVLFVHNEEVRYFYTRLNIEKQLDEFCKEGS